MKQVKAKLAFWYFLYMNLKASAHFAFLKYFTVRITLMWSQTRCNDTQKLKKQQRPPENPAEAQLSTSSPSEAPGQPKDMNNFFLASFQQFKDSSLSFQWEPQVFSAFNSQASFHRTTLLPETTCIDTYVEKEAGGGTSFQGSLYLLAIH